MRLGAVLGPSWGRLGPSWVRLVVSWGLLESILAHLGASWDRLAASSKHLQSVLGRVFGRCGIEKNKNHMSDSIFRSIRCCFLLRNSMPEEEQIIEIPLVLQSGLETRHIEIVMGFGIDFITNLVEL